MASWEPGTDSTNIYTGGTGITVNGTTINANYTAGTGINISNGVINSAWTYNSGSNDISNSNSGNVGIGKNPAYSLDVNGPINTDSVMFGGITVLSDKGFNSLFIGQGAGSKNSGNNNYFSDINQDIVIPLAQITNLKDTRQVTTIPQAATIVSVETAPGLLPEPVQVTRL